MSKFKVGDKVKRVVDTEFPEYGFVRKGFVGKVLDADEGCIKVDDKAGRYNREGDFVLAGSFTINAGDYIDSRKFTREECERFCELANENGFYFTKSDGAFSIPDWGFRQDSSEKLLGVLACSHSPQLWWEKSVYFNEIENKTTNNITTQFREFLDKEKGMSKFTKDDFEDGQRIYLEAGAKTIHGIPVHEPLYVCGDEATARLPDGVFATLQFSTLSEGLKTPSGKKVMRIIDRDGTVLFEREPEKVKLELEVTPEQAEAIRKQLNQ